MNILEKAFILMRKKEVFEGEVIKKINKDKVIEICTNVIDENTFESVYVLITEIEWCEFDSLGDRIRVKGYNVSDKYV